MVKNDVSTRQGEVGPMHICCIATREVIEVRYNFAQIERL